MRQSLVDAATDGTPSLTEITAIHSTAYAPRVSIGDGLRRINLELNTTGCDLRRDRYCREQDGSEQQTDD
jgi:hypothetical protein